MDVKQKIDWIRGLAEEQGRDVRFGIRLHTISRDSAKEAWATADRLLGDLDPETIAAAQQALGRSESVGQQRMLALHGGSRDKLEISPNLWGVSVWCGAVRARHWSAVMRMSRTGSRSITHWVWSTSCSPATRTWRRRTGSVRGHAGAGGARTAVHRSGFAAARGTCRERAPGVSAGRGTAADRRGSLTGKIPAPAQLVEA